MRKTLLVSIVVFLVVVAASLAISWFLQAWEAKANAEKFIASLNAKQTYFTYDAIETSGFPTDMRLTIVRPHFSGRVDQLLASLPQEPGKPVAPMPAWNEDITLDGSVTLGINALSNRYTFALSGNWRDTSDISGQPVSMNSQQPYTLSCLLQLGRSDGWFGSLWNFGALAGNSEALLKNFRTVDCNSSAYAVINSASQEPLFSSGPARFYLMNQPQGDRLQLRLYAKTADSEVSTAGDALIDAYTKALSPNYPFPARMSAYGKQNIEVDASYSGAADLTRAAKDSAFDIAVDKLDVSNQLYSSSSSFHLASTPQGSNRTVSLTLKSESNFNDQYDALLQDALKRLIASTLASPDPKYASLQPTLQKHNADEWYALIYPAVPNFHSLGKTVLGLDLSYQGDANFTSGEANLANLEITAAPYGITGKGAAKRAPGQLFPAANMEFTCSNCLRLVDDVMDYQARLQKMLAEFGNEPAAYQPMDPKLPDGIKAFLSALAAAGANQSADKTTFAYTLVSDGGNNVTINGKRMDEITALYNQYVTPFLQKPAQPAMPAH